jgi:hypothetical protein
VETGPELVYAFTLAGGSDYVVTATLSDLTADLDVFLLASGGCEDGVCLDPNAYGDFQASAANVPPGTYLVVVDGYQSGGGSFTLDLTCASIYRVFLPLTLRNH